MAKHYDKQFKLDAVQYYHDKLNASSCQPEHYFNFSSHQHYIL